MISNSFGIISWVALVVLAAAGLATAEQPATEITASLSGKWICVGASITQGSLASKPELNYVSCLSRFATRDQCKVEIINDGRSGWSTGAYAYNAAKLAKKIPSDTTLITILLGTNDLREKKAPDEIGKTAARNLEKLITAYLQEVPKARIVLITPTAVYPEKFTEGLRNAGYDDQGPEKLKAIGTDLKALANRLHLQLIDASSLPALEDSVEGVHPNDHGHLQLAELIWREVRAGNVGTVEAPRASARPKLTFDRADVQQRIGVVYADALHNPLDINTVQPTKPGDQNPIGRLTVHGKFIRAGAGYNNPWTRDASLNSWFAGSLLEPAVAQNTLWAVCQKRDDGAITVQRDNQWWDQCIWAIAAWNHYAVTGDRSFLESAYPVASETLESLKRDHFNVDYGLYMGPAFFADGIAGYPPPEYDSTNKSSFVLDHRHTRELMALSTNCLYRQAYQSTARMARALGKTDDEAGNFEQQSESIKHAINQHLWSAERGEYAYFLSSAGPDAGKLFFATEGSGRAFALLFDIADANQKAASIQKMHSEPKGIVTLWPTLPGFDDEHPGRHNVMIWPLVNGLWAMATAQSGVVDLFANEVDQIASLVTASQHSFYEIYNPQSGKPDGGWQNNRHWEPLADQTWSATAYIASIHYGLFGMSFTEDGLRLSPKLPGWGSVEIDNLPYRNATLAIRLTGTGTHIHKFTLDQKDLAAHLIPANLQGSHRIEIHLSTEE